MSEVSTIGLDLAKNVFQVHGADASGVVIIRKKLRRDQVLAFFAGRSCPTSRHDLLARLSSEQAEQPRRAPGPEVSSRGFAA